VLGFLEIAWGRVPVFVDGYGVKRVIVSKGPSQRWCSFWQRLHKVLSKIVVVQEKQ